AAADIGMRVAEFADHLAEQVVEVRAIADVLEFGLVLRAQSLPVVAVHVGGVEVVAIAAPYLAEYLGVLLARIARERESRRVDALAILAVAVDVVHLVAVAVLHQHLFAIVGELRAVDVLDQRLVLARLYVEGMDLRLEAAVAAVEERIAERVH